MKYLLIVLLMFLPGAYASDYCNERQISGTVLKVTDGDTIKIETEDDDVSIRMLNIDTPELHFQGKSQGEWAERAQVYLSKLTPVGSTVRVIADKEVCDRYNRYLGVVYTNQNVNLKMVEAGFAAPYILYPNFGGTSEMLFAASQAKNKGLGIWSANIMLPYLWRKHITGEEFRYYVGSYPRHCFVNGSEIDRIKPTDRVFFFKKFDAIEAGYNECSN